MPEVMDPVCGMVIDKEKAKYKIVYKGRIYYFCSLRCKEAFERRPESYLSSGPEGMSTGTMEL